MGHEPLRQAAVSVVVPVLNASRTLPACLAAVAQLDPPPIEILFVDNGSVDGGPSIIQAFQRDHPSVPVRVLTEPRRGASAARNRGIQAAKGDIVVFTDSDCSPDPAWLRQLVPAFADPAIAAAAGRIVAAPARSTVERFCALYTLPSSDKPARYERWSPWEGGFPTANFAARKAVLEKLRGFDETVCLYGEDYDLCARTYAQGAAIAYVPEAVTYHHHRTTVGGVVRQAFGFGRSHPYLLSRHARSGLWLDLPRRSFVLPRFPLPVWLDLASADKKVLAVLALSAWHAAALWLMVPLAMWLVIGASRRARHRGMPVQAAAIGLAGLLLLKSFAMTAGRWWGSAQYKVLCL
jgi:glycosyltransferase involved in cell wall biosynthesis